MKNWKLLSFQVLKYFFILLLIFTAIGKLLDIPGFAEIIATYQLGISGHLATVLGLGLALFELGLALYMIRKPLSLVVGPLLTLMHSTYTLLAIITVSRGIELENCGCFAVLPAAMKGMSANEKKDYVQVKAKERQDIQQEISELSESRDTYVAEKKRELVAASPSMSDALTTAIKQQAEEKEFIFKK